MVDRARYLPLFLEEATDHVGELGRALLTLEKDPFAAEALEICFRMAHSIKGMAASMSLGPITDCAHALEDRLGKAQRAGRVDPVVELPLWFTALDRLERLLRSVRDTGECVAEPATAEEVAGPAGLKKKLRRMPLARLNEEFKPPVSLRVRTESLDRLLSSVGEVVLASTQLRDASRDTTTAESVRLSAGLDRMDRVLGDLGRRALELRTAPLLRVTEKLPRLARELGLALGKRLSLELEGEDLELDRSILDRLADPLLHLIRNSVAHGIETPDERMRCGKSEVGSIRVVARRVRDSIEIAVVDDGGGIDVDAVRARAVAAGLLSADLAEDLPPADVARLAFQHGLSTAATVSELAGRGVGLDAVRASLEAMGGEVDLVSEAGHGTTALLRVPLSAAVQRVILIGVGEERLAIPITRVERIEEIDSSEIERAGGEAFVRIDGHPLPLLELAELLAVEPVVHAPRTMVLLSELHGQRTALRFDRLLGQQEIFVKPVPRLLMGLHAVCGLTLAADGRPVFLIEPGQLI